VSRARAERGFRLCCAALVAGMIAGGGVQAAWQIDVVEGLPEFSVCVARWLSEIPCPGCGMLRALLRLGQLRFAEALLLHPLSLPCALGALWVVLGSPGRGRLQAGRHTSSHSASDWLVGSAIAVVLAVWALRLSIGFTA
jgi:hypothetical protein